MDIVELDGPQLSRSRWRAIAGGVSGGRLPKVSASFMTLAKRLGLAAWLPTHSVAPSIHLSCSERNNAGAIEQMRSESGTSMVGAISISLMVIPVAALQRPEARASTPKA
jgi:hypothetical protein